MEWFVVQAYSGYEQKVKAAMEERIMLADLKEKFGEILVPTEQVVELKSGEQKKKQKENSSQDISSYKWNLTMTLGS